MNRAERLLQIEDDQALVIRWLEEVGFVRDGSRLVHPTGSRRYHVGKKIIKKFQRRGEVLAQTHEGWVAEVADHLRRLCRVHIAKTSEEG